MHETAFAVGGPVGPNTRSQYECTAYCRRRHGAPRNARTGIPGSRLPQCLPAQLADAQGRVLLPPPVSRRRGRLLTSNEGPQRKVFLQDIDRYAVTHGIPIIPFQHGQRKEDVAAEYLRRRDGTSDAILFIGKAQEKVRTFRTEGRRNERGETYPWIVESTAMVNQYYFYGCDEDFGPFFIKYSSYFPYGAKLCFNGHEYLKRQLAKEKIGYEELANGILSCDNPKRMQQLADRLSPARIARFWKKWQRRLPCPFSIDERCSDVQKTSQDFAMSEELFREVTGPREVEGQRASALKFGDPVVFALFSVLVLFRLLPCGFRSRDLRDHVATLLGNDPSQWTQGRLTYQLRRLPLHGLIERVKSSHRYVVTERGYRVA